MKPLPLPSDLPDRMNPVLVRDLRQGMRAKLFGGVVALLLAGAVGFAALAVAIREGWFGDGASGASLGEPLMWGYLGVLALALLVALPVGAYQSFMQERTSEAWPLLLMTGLAPRRILRGKILGVLVLGMLCVSALAPFLLFTYFLEGVGLLEILFAVAVLLAAHALMATVSVSAATFGKPRSIRAAPAVVVPMVLLGIAGSGLSAAFGAFGPGSTSSPEFRYTVLLILWIVPSLAALLFESAAAQLMPLGENSAFGPRVAAAVHLAGVVALSALVPAGSIDRGLVVLGWGALFVAFLGLLLATETDGMARALRASRAPRLLLPGALRGVGLMLVLQLAVTASALALLDHAEAADYVVALPSWCVMVVCLPVALGRALAPQNPTTLLVLRGAIPLFAAACIVGGVLLDAADSSSADPGPLEMVLSPISALADSKDKQPWPVVVAGCASAAAALLVLWKKDKAAVAPEAR